MDTKAERLGWIGLGNMGHPMAQNLQKAGFPLIVYNRSPQRTQDFAATCCIAQSIEELVQASDIIFTMVTNDEAVGAVYGQILQVPDLQGKLFVDMSTISQKLSVSTGQSITAAGAAFIDAPVAGSTKPAAEGTLIIMAGGEAKDLARAMPYLQKMGRLIKHTGENGKGIAAKLSVNYFLSLLYLGLAEAVLFAGQQGIGREDILTIINESAAGSGATKVKTPLLLAEDYRPAFALELMLKDVLLARDGGARFPLTEAVAGAYQAAHDAGFGPKDVIGIIEWLKNK
jgi:3-hydroxyisobutyrate dehydrogenase